MQRLVVVGGGISGLAAATAARAEAERAGTPLEIVVLERDATVGGKAQTRRHNTWLVEGGPTGYLDNEPVLDRLVAAAGLEKLPAQAASARRFVVHGGTPRELKPSPLGFAKSGLLSPLGLLRIALEPFQGRGDDKDESVWEFARRRLGRQAADRLIAPMVLGVFAGDAKRISLPAAFPRMAELERDYGSLIRAMIKIKRAKGRDSGGPAGPAGTLTSFRDGLQSLPVALAEHGDFEVRTGAEVAGLARAEDGGWRVAVTGDAEPIPADAVVLAGEGWAVSQLLAEVAPRVAVLIDGIPFPPVLVVALGYAGASAQQVPRGFGALIPRGEGYRALGVLWDTHLFPGRSAEGHVLARAMLGGAVDEAAGDLSEEEATAIATEDVGRLLGLPEAPIFSRVVRWPRAIPQYELGHLTRVRAVEEELQREEAGLEGLDLAGNYLHGVAFGKAAATGWDVGIRAAENLNLRAGRPRATQNG